MSKIRNETMAVEATKYTMRLRQDELNEQGQTSDESTMIGSVTSMITKGSSTGGNYRVAAL